MMPCVALAALALSQALTAGCSGPGTAGSESAVESIAPTDVITSIWVQIQTGGDDKRSDSHVTLEINFNDGSPSVPCDLGEGQTWDNNTTTPIMTCRLGAAGVQNQQIASLTVAFNQGGGGFNGDNWNMQRFEAGAVDSSGAWHSQGQRFNTQDPAAPLIRFTGSTKTWSTDWDPTR